jgi:hypothetical protein
VDETALGEDRNAEDVRWDMRSRERLCMVDSSGRLEICEREAAISRARSDLSTATSDFLMHMS